MQTHEAETQAVAKIEKRREHSFLDYRAMLTLNALGLLSAAVFIFINSQREIHTYSGMNKYAFLLLLFVTSTSTWYFFKAQNRKKYLESLGENHDALTKVWNREYFNNKLFEEVSRAGRYQYPLTLCFLNLDNLRVHNDKFGNDSGDRLLKGLAQYIQETVRGLDVFARYEGDTFVILFPHTDLESSLTVVERLQAGVAREIECTFGAGLTAYGAGESVAKFELRAREALQKAKSDGPNRMRYLNGSSKVLRTVPD